MLKNETFFLRYNGYLEDGVDNLTAIDGSKNRKDLTQAHEWTIDSDVTLEFRSDGSLDQAGFLVFTQPMGNFSD